MKTKKIENAMSQYEVYTEGGAHMGKVGRVGMARTTGLWVVDPVDYEMPTNFRIGYKTKRDAMTALWSFVNHEDKEYAAAAYIGSEPETTA